MSLKADEDSKFIKYIKLTSLIVGIIGGIIVIIKTFFPSVSLDNRLTIPDNISVEIIQDEQYPDYINYYFDVAFEYLQQSDFHNSKIYFEKALEEQVRISAPIDLKMSRIWSNLGMINHNISEYQNALDCYMNEVTILKDIYDENSSEVAYVYCKILNVYLSLEDYDNAIKYLDKALKIFEKIDEESFYTAVSYEIISVLHYNLEDFDKALDYQIIAVSIYEDTIGVEHSITASSYKRISYVYEKLGNFDTALEYQNKASLIQEKIQSMKNEDG